MKKGIKFHSVLDPLNNPVQNETHTESIRESFFKTQS